MSLRNFLGTGPVSKPLVPGKVDDDYGFGQVLGHRDLCAAELFSGIGGFRLASDSLGIKTVWANDFSASAAEVYMGHFGNDVFAFGDLHDYLDDVPAHDILTGGFPCQPFSSAGKKRGHRDERSSAFEALVGVLERRRPRLFVLENVKRLLSMEKGAHFAQILRSLTAAGYVVEWRLSNTAHHGLAQNRERVIVVGQLGEEVKGSLLVGASDFCRSHVQAEWLKISQHGRAFPWWGIAAGDRFLASDLREPELVPAVLLRDVLEGSVEAQFDLTESTVSRLVESTRVDRYFDSVQIIWNQGGGARMGYTIYGINGLSPTLTSSTSRHYERYEIGGRFRRLTPTEYARLQGFPDGYCDAVGLRHRYVLFGNAIAPPLAEWGLRTALGDEVSELPNVSMTLL